MNDKCPNVKEVPGICDGLPVFCRGCTESVNRHTQLMSESRDEVRKELKAALLQLSEEKKLKEGYYDEAKKGWESFRVAERLNESMKKTLDHLFSDPAIHPVVMRRFVGSSKEGVPTIDEGIQKCKRCVDALLAVSETYFALKRKCGLAKPLGSGERCVREFGHLEPCDHR